MRGILGEPMIDPRIHQGYSNFSSSDAGLTEGVEEELAAHGRPFL